MKLMKMFFFSAIILFSIITGIGLLLPATVNISRAIDISKDSAIVLSKLNDIQQWSTWMEGLKDSATQKSFENNSWKTSNTRIRIISTEKNSIKTGWETGSQTHESSFNVFAASENKTTVQWLFVQHFKWYPWERVSSIFIEKGFGQVMEQSLHNFKQICESSNSEN